CQQYQSLPYTF
nr:immunoglobulin light chain junction region [Macaca mulatta]